MSGRILLSGAFAVAASAVWLGATSCGGGGAGDPYCGDGIQQPERGEQCDDGNDIDDDACHNDCTANLPGATRISWLFNGDAAPMFTNDSCTDLGVIRVRVTVTGPTTATTDESCALKQVTFQDLPAGMYTIKVEPLDINDMLLIDAPVETTTNLGPGAMVEVVIPPDAWIRSYKGTFFFRVQWGGADCDSAAPPVVQQRLTMTQNGAMVAQSTEDGVPLDGSSAGACQPFANEFPQSALQVPFGAATLTIEGLDGSGTPQFSETFDTFVGAGISNPELHFDVNSLTPDAGVPDGGTADADVPDAL